MMLSLMAKKKSQKNIHTHYGKKSLDLNFNPILKKIVV